MQSDKRNLSMVMDLYELTMSYGYFKSHDINKKVAFDVFIEKIQKVQAMLFLQVLIKL